MPANAQGTPKRLIEPQRLQMLAISVSGFAFDPQSGQSFMINETGVKALGHLREGASVEDTARALAQQYAVPQAIIAGAVDFFVRQLGRYLA